MGVPCLSLDDIALLDKQKKMDGNTGVNSYFNPLAPFTALHRGLDERPRGTLVVPGNDISAWRIAHGQRNRRRGGMTSGDEDYPTTSNIFIKEIPGAHQYEQTAA